MIPALLTGGDYLFSYRGVVENGLLTHESVWFAPLMTSQPRSEALPLCFPPGTDLHRLSSSQKESVLKRIAAHDAFVGDALRTGEGTARTKTVLVIPPLIVSVAMRHGCPDTP